MRIIVITKIKCIHYLLKGSLKINIFMKEAKKQNRSLKMKKIFILVMALAVMISASIYAQGINANNKKPPQSDGKNSKEQCECDNCPPKGKGIDMSKLSQSQRTQVQAINQKYAIDLSNFSLDIQKQNNIIKAEMMKDSPNKTTIDAAIDTKSNLQAQMAKMEIEKRLAIQAVVKPANSNAAVQS